MQNTCPNPGCGAAYNLTPQHVGRHFTCQKCGVPLTVDAGGLRLGDPSPGVIGVPQSTPTMQRGELGLLNDYFSWAFWGGSFLVILFLFLPLLDMRGHARLQAKLHALQRDNGEASAMPRDRDAAAKRDDRNKDEIKRLEEKIHQDDLDSQMAGYWYTWGQLLGFLILSAAAIGWLDPRQNKSRRVTGGVVICGELLAIFIYYVIASGVAMR